MSHPLKNELIFQDTEMKKEMKILEQDPAKFKTFV